MKKEKVMKILTDYDKLKNEIITITEKLNELDKHTYSKIEDIESLDVEYHQKTKYVELVSEEYYTGCGGYDHDYCEFPLRYLWEDFESEILEEKEKRERSEKEKKEKEEEKKTLAIQEKDKKDLINLVGKLKNNQISLDDDFTSALNELFNKNLKQKGGEK